jgi:hypothetical protein
MGGARRPGPSLTRLDLRTDRAGVLPDRLERTCELSRARPWPSIAWPECALLRDLWRRAS